MPRAVLLYNSVSGRRPQHRVRTVEHVAEALRAHDFTIDMIPIEGPGTAGPQALRAANDGTDILFACGGDGTIHEIIQGLAFHPRATLGIIPVGTANALARHIGLALSPVKAALQQLTAAPVSVPLGQIDYILNGVASKRYFAVMAGVGPDGALIRGMASHSKHRLGRLAYYLSAIRLLATVRFPAFTTITHPINGEPMTLSTVGAMAVRVNDLGGLFSPMTPAGTLDTPHLSLTVIRPPAPISLPMWFGLAWLGQHHRNPLLHTLDVASYTCEPPPGIAIPLQADGEWLGDITEPIRFSLAPSALRILIPEKV